MNDQPTHAGRITISVDAMGGDAGPAVVVAGLAKSAGKNPNIGFLLHGPEQVLRKLVAKRRVLEGRVVFRDCPDVVTMEDKPSQVVRNGKQTSMWSALEAVRQGEAHGAVELSLSSIEQGGEKQRLSARGHLLQPRSEFLPRLVELALDDLDQLLATLLGVPVLSGHAGNREEDDRARPRRAFPAPSIGEPHEFSFHG